MPLGVVFILLASLLAGHSSCARLLPPVEGPIVRTYAPVGAYGGHWASTWRQPPVPWLPSPPQAPSPSPGRWRGGSRSP